MDDNIDRRSHFPIFDPVPMELIKIVSKAVREAVREGTTEAPTEVVEDKGDAKGGKVVYFIKGGESSESSERVRERS